MKRRSTLFRILILITLCAAMMLPFPFSLVRGTGLTIPWADPLSAPHADLLPLQDVDKMVAGWSHTCALMRSGGIKCWGNNLNGQLGDGTTSNRQTPTDVVGLSSGVRALAIGTNHSCALTTSGGIKCWGMNTYGQLGNGTTTDQTTPVDVVGLSSGVSGLSVGSHHTCALTTSGGAMCWGYNPYGQIGDGTTTNRLSPVAVTGLSSNVSSLTAGAYHTCALTTSGSAKCWGLNNSGELGNGNTTTQRSPVAVLGLPSSVSKLAAGWSYTCALAADGVKCWGYNLYGQLGDGTTINRQTPVAVVDISNEVSTLEVGGFHSCVTTTNGSAKCWGDNNYGQLGDGTRSNRARPTAVTGLSSGVRGIAVGVYHTCVVMTTSGAKCWGYNYAGQVGDGTTSAHQIPMLVTGLNSAVNAIAIGGFHSCALVATGVKCWGYNYAGQVGDGTNSDRQIPVDVVGLSSGVSALAAGWFHTCALITTGVKCWGYNGSGQLGDGTTNNQQSPIDVTGLISGVSSVAVGGSHSCAVMTNGSVMCWGANFSGQLGDGTVTNRQSPVDVTGLSSAASMLAAGRSHTCALTASGVFCWGYNSYGQLGDNSSVARYTPVAVVGLSSGVQALTAGGDHTCALMTNGGVKCWGRNSSGQLGDGSTITRQTPTDVTGLSSGVKAVTASEYHTCALLTSGGVLCWGSNSNGQLGDGTTSDRQMPVAVIDLSSDVSGVEAGGGYNGFTDEDWSHTCALTTAGSIKCWGANVYGQLGDGNAWRWTPVDVLIDRPAPVTSTPTPTETTMPTVPPSNQHPTTVITAPNDGSSVTVGNVVTITATASDTDGTITQVRFQANGTEIPGCTLLVAPYECLWTPTIAERVNLTVIATDNNGATTTSLPVGITITAAETTPTPTATTATTPNAVNSQISLPLIIKEPPPMVTPPPAPSWQRLSQAGLNGAALAILGEKLFVGERRDQSHPGGLYQRALSGCTPGSTVTRFSGIESSVLGLVMHSQQAIVPAYDLGMFYSNDAGVVWTKSGSPVDRPRTVLISGGIIYAGTENAGLYLSEDGGITWARRDGNPKAINVLQIQVSTLWIGTDTTGVWKLIAGGISPVQQNGGLNNEASKKIWDIGFDASNTIYLATDDGIYRGNGNVNNPWEPMSTDIKLLRSLEIVGDQLYIGTVNNGVWQRPLSGGTWQRVTSAGWNHTIAVRDLLYDPNLCQGLLAATDDGVWVYR